VKMKKRSLAVFFVALAYFIVGSNVGIAQAGGTTGWATDERVPGYLDDTFTPFLLADQNRTVHAFASQWVENDGRRKAIVYRQWTLMGGWTRPIDIILAPSGDAEFLWAYLDKSDTVHMIFMAGKTQNLAVYYTSAPAINADWAPAWSEPVAMGWSASGLNTAAITGDDQGNLVVIYGGYRDGNGVYYTVSNDSGRTWSESIPIFLTYDAELSVFSLRLAIGAEKKPRAAWNVVTNLGIDEALYFSSYDFKTDKWDTPVELERRIDLLEYFGPSFPAIVDNGKEIVVIYNSGNPFTGRPVGAGRPIQRARVSTDGGLTWSEPRDPFPFHVGRSGEHALVLDGEGIPHTMFIQRIESADENGDYSIIGGTWHSAFENDGWTNPDRFVTTFAAHDVRAVVCQGNVLLVVWREDPGVGADGIWFSYSILDEPELPVVPLATAAIDYSFQQEVTITPPSISTPEPTDYPDFLDESPPSGLGSNPAMPIIIGAVPVILILVGIFVGYRFLLNHRE